MSGECSQAGSCDKRTALGKRTSVTSEHQSRPVLELATLPESIYEAPPTQFVGNAEQKINKNKAPLKPAKSLREVHIKTTRHTMAAPSTSPLLRLPAELRNRINHLALLPSNSAEHIREGLEAGSHIVYVGFRWVTQSEPGLLQASQQAAA